MSTIRANPVFGLSQNGISKMKLTSTQIGALGEAVASTQLMSLSDGRFSPFMPMADDDGLDLILFDKMTGQMLPVQVKTRTTDTLAKAGTVQFDVRIKTYSERTGEFLLAILLDTKTGNVHRAWLIEMNDLINVSHAKRDKLSIVPNASSTSKDKFTEFRCEGMTEVVEKLIGFLDGPSSLK